MGKVINIKIDKQVSQRLQNILLTAAKNLGWSGKIDTSFEFNEFKFIYSEDDPEVILIIAY